MTILTIDEIPYLRHAFPDIIAAYIHLWEVPTEALKDQIHREKLQSHITTSLRTDSNEYCIPRDGKK